MKNIILFAAIFWLTATLFAQNPALSVPKFKGIEITGTIDQFGIKLSSQGFKLMTKDDNSAFYMGRFAGMDDCLVGLFPVENSKDISTVAVLIGLNLLSDYGTYSSYESWEKLLNDYNDLKELLTEKYGKPTEENEGFANGAYTYSSYAKLSSVKNGQCEYFTTWGDSDVDKMVIQLAISGGKSMGFDCAVITLKYWNEDKLKDSRKEIIDDL